MADDVHAAMAMVERSAGESVLDGAALDKYSFTRDAFLQRRRSLILDGEDDEPPPDPTTDKK